MAWTKSMAQDDQERFMFKELSDEEEGKFRQWARENYTPGTLINSAWHPVVKSECLRINEEVNKR